MADRPDRPDRPADSADERRATQEFFGPRAAGWDDRFPDDEPAYRAAIAELGVLRGGTALDAACGTGRAVPLLQEVVGPSGRVVALDLTSEMLVTAAAKGRGGGLVLGDARALPLRTGSVDSILAAGLLPHLLDAAGDLSELARVTRPGGTLGLFHPISRVALAARHGGVPAPEDVRTPAIISGLLRRTGWEPELLDDGPDRYLVVARRTGG